MKIEMMEVSVNNKIKNIYPLAYINKNNSIYIIYTDVKEIKDFKDNLYVGEVKDNIIYPIAEELIPYFEKVGEGVTNKVDVEMI